MNEERHQTNTSDKERRKIERAARLAVVGALFCYQYADFNSFTPKW